MKLHFDFTLDQFQADAFLDCIQKKIVNLTAAKLDHFDSKPHVEHLDGLIKYYENIQKIVANSMTRIP